MCSSDLHATAASGLVGLGEVHSFHHYDLPESIEYYVDCYRQWLGANGRQALPLWLTEAGSHVTQPITRGSADATPDRTRGMILLAKVVEAYAGGVARFFAFLYAPYHEAGQDFSMTDPAGSPYRNLATYVNAARVLRGKEFIGDWPVNEIGRAHV